MDKLSTQSKEPMRMHRRSFFGWAGASAIALAMSQTGCKKEDKETTTLTAVFLGKDDEGLMNFAYAMEQVVTTFYQKVTSSPYAAMSSAEQAYLQDLRNHQETYVAFFKNNLRFNHIADLDIDVSGIDYANRASVLAAAIEMADWQTQAYNGMAHLLENTNNLLTIAKVASVKARVQAALRNWTLAGSYATGIDSNGLDGIKSPQEALSFFKRYIKTPLDSNQLPSA